jgi:hypothetical protein
MTGFDGQTGKIFDQFILPFFNSIDPQRHFAIVNCRIAKGSLDHLVGDGEQLRWHLDA